jgi:hypothetical protein
MLKPTIGRRVSWHLSHGPSSRQKRYVTVHTYRHITNSYLMYWTKLIFFRWCYLLSTGAAVISVGCRSQEICQYHKCLDHRPSSSRRERPGTGKTVRELWFLYLPVTDIHLVEYVSLIVMMESHLVSRMAVHHFISLLVGGTKRWCLCCWREVLIRRWRMRYVRKY